ncbi:MAG: hypothetical protein AUJ07_06290 [Crenarchaeota archaeon 13_1_40CM_3_53_5]|nr:MAG: hypothetical protein AUJ07_06290 [Crenarchaeota archaeon 13_1_40CM_3_53_5]
MKVLLVHPEMHVYGGGTRVAVHFLNVLKGMGGKVDLLCELFDTVSFEDFFGCPGIFRGVRIFAYSRSDYGYHGPSGFRQFAVYKRMVQQSLRRRTRYFNDYDLILSTQKIYYTWKTRIPTIQYCYLPEPFSYGGSFLRRFYYTIPSKIFQRRASKLAGILAVSEYTRGLVTRRWGLDSTVLYPPCPIFSKRQNDRREPWVVTVGRVVPEKRLEVFMDVARSMPDFQFFLVGSISEDDTDYYRKILESKPENAVIILKPLRKVTNLLEKASFYLHCAIGEQFGISIVEAMSAGCIPIVHASGGQTETVGDSRFLWKSIEQIPIMLRAFWNEDRGTLSERMRMRSKQFSPEVFESNLRTYLEKFKSP